MAHPSPTSGDARPQVKLCLLGAFELRVGRDALPITATQQRAVLAALALVAPEPMLTERLIDLLWPERVPASARTALHNTIRRLRATFSEVGVADLIETGPDGYRLKLHRDQIDAHHFLAVLAKAREAASLGNDHGAATSYAAALAIWRGDPLPDLSAAGLLLAETQQLVELRVCAAEEWTDVETARGQAESVLTTLRTLAEQWPLRESLRARLMVALHASGRTAEALEEYSRARADLVKDLGIEPGPLLRAAHQRILRLDDDPPDIGRPSVPIPIPAQLPTAPISLVGRAGSLAVLNEELGTSSSYVVSGPAGVGKTTLSVYWARSVADRFPDGQLFVNLRGFDPDSSPLSPHEVLRGFLTALGISLDEVPLEFAQAVGMYRSMLANRRVLVLLDNARDADQVRDLLPTGPGCLALVTSRQELAALAVTNGTRSVSLDLLTAKEARVMMADRIGAPRVAAEPEAVTEIIERCGRLPLALAVVAAQAAARPESSIAALAKQLRPSPGAGTTALDVLHLGDPRTDVRAVLSWSVTALSPDAARLFGVAGLHPGAELSVSSLGSACAITPRQARAATEELLRANLLIDRGNGRVGFHDLIRAYARELGGHDPERVNAIARVVDHYLQSAHAATRRHFSSPLPFVLPPPFAGVCADEFESLPEASVWLEAEQSVLVQVVVLAGLTPGLESHAWQLARTLNGYLWDRCQWHDMARMHEAALDATRRDADLVGQADALHGVAEAMIGLGRREALVPLEEALKLFGQLGDLMGESDVRCTFGRFHESQGEFAEAIVHTEAALEIYQQIGDRIGQAVALNNIGWLSCYLKDYERGLVMCEQALVIYRAEGDGPGQTYALDSLGTAYAGLGDHLRAIACIAEGAELARELGQHFNQAANLIHLGACYEAIGDLEAARSAWRPALAILEALEHARAEGLRARLEAITPAL